MTIYSAKSPASKRNLVRREILKREAAYAHLLGFTTYTFPGYVVRPHHRLIAEALMAVFRGDIPRLMVFVSPQSGKSELCSRNLPAFWLGHRPDTRIILTSYAADLAQSFSRDARDIIESSAFRNVFGPMGLVDESEYVEVSGELRRVDYWGIKDRRGRLRATGIGGGITGHGADLGIIDDPVKDEAEAQSESYRKRAKEWYDGAFHTRLSPSARVVFIQTRWHEDDLGGYLLEQQAQGGELWWLLRLPAVAETDEEREEFCLRHHVTSDRYVTQSSLGLTQILST